LTNWKVALPTTINDRGVWTIQGTGANGLVATFYFDKETGLMTRYIRYVTTNIGRVPTQIDFSDFRPVAGVMMPFKWTYQWISGREEYEINQYDPNATVDASKFAEPSLKK
jgi:outer membrane lipoprotein-sorting protein